MRLQHLPPVQAVRDDYPALSVLKAVVQPLRVDLLRHPTGIIIPVAALRPPRIMVRHHPPGVLRIISKPANLRPDAVIHRPQFSAGRVRVARQRRRTTLSHHQGMDLPPIYASPGDRNDDVSAAEMAQRHLAVTPLLRGLGGSLTMSNSDDADDFLEEAGRTLQAAIKGLLDLQQQRNSLSDKHLRPLEDNPLRLNMDYATALDVMFAEGKSPVHLAAPAAVSESLRNVRHHEEATCPRCLTGWSKR